MTGEQELIPVLSEDLQEFKKAGIDVGEISRLLHSVATGMKARGQAAKAAQPSGLTPAEIAVLEAGGARGLSGDSAKTAPAKRQMAVIQLEMEYLRLKNTSLDGQQVAKKLKVSQARVRQRALPGNAGLYSYRTPSGERRFPLWQFHDSTIIPYLRELLKALNPDLHPVTVQRFMTTEHPDLESPTLHDCLSPRDWLITGHQHEDVLVLARDL
jgi:DNA-binding CsgD family transcriptional regulator